MIGRYTLDMSLSAEEESPYRHIEVEEDQSVPVTHEPEPGDAIGAFLVATFISGLLSGAFVVTGPWTTYVYVLLMAPGPLFGLGLLAGAYLCFGSVHWSKSVGLLVGCSIAWRLALLFAEAMYPHVPRDGRAGSVAFYMAIAGIGAGGVATTFWLCFRSQLPAFPIAMRNMVLAGAALGVVYYGLQVVVGELFHILSQRQGSMLIYAVWQTGMGYVVGRLLDKQVVSRDDTATANTADGS